MIYINGTILSDKIKIESVDGLYDFPELKQQATDWDDNRLLEWDDSQDTWQFKTKKIKINCYLTASTYGSALSEYANIQSALSYDGLKCMTIPSYTNRGFMVYHSDGSFIKTKYNLVNSQFRFQLIFIEPQPFNIQFYYDFSSLTALSLIIGKSDKSLSIASDAQRYVTVYFNGISEEVNVEQDNYFFNDSIGPGIYHCIIYGDVDKINSIISSLTPEYETIANYYFRNGTIA